MFDLTFPLGKNIFYLQLHALTYIFILSVLLNFDTKHIVKVAFICPKNCGINQRNPKSHAQS